MPSSPPAVFSPPSGSTPGAPEAVFTPAAGGSPGAPAAVFTAPGGGSPSSPAAVFTAPGGGSPSAPEAIFAAPGGTEEGTLRVSGITNPTAANGDYAPSGTAGDGKPIYLNGAGYKMDLTLDGLYPRWGIMSTGGTVYFRAAGSGSSRADTPDLESSWTALSGTGTPVVEEAGLATPPEIFTPAAGGSPSAPVSVFTAPDGGSPSEPAAVFTPITGVSEPSHPPRIFGLSADMVMSEAGDEIPTESSTTYISTEAS